MPQRPQNALISEYALNRTQVPNTVSITCLKLPGPSKARKIDPALEPSGAARSRGRGTEMEGRVGIALGVLGFRALGFKLYKGFGFRTLAGVRLGFRGLGVALP